ncbi:MAG: hypothetical protein PHS37_06500 [Candidatus Omnitrophica bacterium]|nr:hypothetical protein [Candidatus Omnitrophota bacterium]
MTLQRFRPDEILFALTDACNLRCSHCGSTAEGAKPVRLNTADAVRFLKASGRMGIKRIGFTGGEPFLAVDLLCALCREAVRNGMTFSRIMTNAAWFRTEKELTHTLRRLFSSGYDGDICVSIDAFHRQDLHKVAVFIKNALAVWRRPDIVSFAVVKGAREKETHKRLNKVLAVIKDDALFIRAFGIDLSPVGKAGRLKNGWDGKWFRDDLCAGPGNVFFVLPDGTVRPCCGYAADTDILTLGAIAGDTPRQLLRNAGKNRFIAALFGAGFHPLRRRLQAAGIRFPGKTSNHCFFCYYLTRKVPRQVLKRCLTAL